MKVQEIEFSQEAAEKLYDDYMYRIQKTTTSISKKYQEQVYVEFNIHIKRALKRTDDANELDALQGILEKLGDPEEVLKLFVADKQMERATKTFNPIHVFTALALNLKNGSSYTICFFLYLLLLGFIVLIPFKIMYPAKIGMHYSEGFYLFFGWSDKTNQTGATELLGNWFIPAMLLLCTLTYLLITSLLKFKMAFAK